MQIFIIENNVRHDIAGEHDCAPHGINWQIYGSDDEPVFDAEPELDAVAYEQWQIDMVDAGLIGDCKFNH